MDSSSARRQNEGSVGRGSVGRGFARAVEWATRREEMQRASAGYDAGADARRLFRRGEELLALADIELAPPDGSLPRPMVALTALREASYWFLRAAGAEDGEDSSAPALAARLQEKPEAIGAVFLREHPLPAELELSRSSLDEANEERQREAARAIQKFCHALSAELNRRLFRLTDLRMSRRLRLSLVALLVAVVLAVALQGAARVYLGPDVASGKPWRTSSSADTCQPSRGVCAGGYTEIFFVTREEDNPWIEIDLLRPTTVRRVEVQNRRDSGAERAVPLVVELSTDGQSFFKVAQRVEPFNLWSASFTPQVARYVRLSVPRRTTLHLERISVRS